MIAFLRPSRGTFSPNSPDNGLVFCPVDLQGLHNGRAGQVLFPTVHYELRFSVALEKLINVANQGGACLPPFFDEQLLFRAQA
jgi:hypothetical protein